MFWASSIPQIKSNYDRNIAFFPQEQELKASLTGLTGFGFKYASLTGSGCSCLLTRGPHALGDTVEHVSSLLRHLGAMLDFVFKASSWHCLFPTWLSQFLQSPLLSDWARFTWRFHGLIFPVAALPFCNLQQMRLVIKSSYTFVCFKDGRLTKTELHKSKIEHPSSLFSVSKPSCFLNL